MIVSLVLEIMCLLIFWLCKDLRDAAAEKRPVKRQEVLIPSDGFRPPATFEDVIESIFSDETPAEITSDADGRAGCGEVQGEGVEVEVVELEIITRGVLDQEQDGSSRSTSMQLESIPIKTSSKISPPKRAANIDEGNSSTVRGEAAFVDVEPQTSTRSVFAQEKDGAKKTSSKITPRKLLDAESVPSPLRAGAERALWPP